MDDHDRHREISGQRRQDLPQNREPAERRREQRDVERALRRLAGRDAHEARIRRSFAT
jgi:hypothetical protein